MSFFSTKASVDFSVSEISSYEKDLEESGQRAVQCYDNTMEMANEIRKALVEVINIGRQNLAACEAEQKYCDNEIEVAEKKKSILYEIEHEIESAMYKLDEYIAVAGANYQRACDHAERIRNQTARDEQEEKIRASKLVAAERQVAACRNEYNDLKNRRTKLYNLKNEVGGEISRLDKICMELRMIETHLKREEERIRNAVDTAERLLEKIDECVEALRGSFSKNIQGGLSTCQQATAAAKARAGRALDQMGALNDKSYSDYERIVVTDVGQLQRDASNMKKALAETISRFKKIYGICENYGGALQDKIMEKSLGLINDLSEQEKASINYMLKKSGQLDEFSRTLTDYYRCKNMVGNY